MSTTEVIEQLKQMDNAERLSVIEAASRMIRDGLSPRERLDRRWRESAAKVRDLYKPGGELTEWTSLDGEEVAGQRPG